MAFDCWFHWLWAQWLIMPPSPPVHVAGINIRTVAWRAGQAEHCPGLHRRAGLVRQCVLRTVAWWTRPGIELAWAPLQGRPGRAECVLWELSSGDRAWWRVGISSVAGRAGPRGVFTLISIYTYSPSPPPITTCLKGIDDCQPSGEYV
jgi:hypothetical protein